MKHWVVKLGGNVLTELGESFFYDCQEVLKRGIGLVIVHGGGSLVTERLREMGLETRFVDGHRVTEDAHREVVTQILAGEENKRWVAKMGAYQLPAIGLTGIDMQLLQVEKKQPELGWVGRIVHVRHGVLESLLQQGWIPCLAPLGVDAQGQHYNINADDVAMAVAQALQADRLILCSDVPGILHEGKLLKQVDQEQVEQLIEKNVITGGMVPKVRSGYRALHGAVREVLITSGKQPHPLTGEGVGTSIVKRGGIKHAAFS